MSVFMGHACRFSSGWKLFSVLFVPDTVSVGASGGIFGLLGLCLASFVTNWDLITLRNCCEKFDTGFSYPALVLLVLAVEMSINIVIGMTPYVDNFAHLGGLVYGILFGIPLMTLDQIKLFGWKQLGHFTRTNLHVVFVILMRVGSFLPGLGLLAWSIWALVHYNGADGRHLCKSCRYITCAEFPFWK